MPHPLIDPLECLARPVATGLGLQICEVQVHTHRIPVTVQVLVRRADGDHVSLDECAALSGPLGEAIESSGLFDASYVLEVSSPGIGEELLTDRDFTSFRGFPVAVVRREASGAEATREGLLLGRDEAAVLLNVRGRTVRIPREDVLRVRLTSPNSDS